MADSQVATTIAQLVAQLNQWRTEYYTNDAPSVEDAEYDKLYRQLEDLETAHPELIQADSPTQHVGGELDADLPKVPHPIPMLSMGDVFSMAELAQWDERLKKSVTTPIDYNVELKIDGLALSLVYQQGKLVQG